MDSSFWIDIINLEWFIVYIKESKVIFPNKIVLLSLKIVFVLANIVDPDEMLHYTAFHLRLHCLPNDNFRSH